MWDHDGVGRFDQMVAEGSQRPLTGWDFSWLGHRLEEDPPPWDYTDAVLDLARHSPDLLDLGTGGGEWLAALPIRPPQTVGAEGWPPNVAVARGRLEPLGVKVVAYESPRDNVDQRSDEPSLPFPADSFHLVADRHESFVASEVSRVLVPGGSFLTQQVGSFESLSRLMEAPEPASANPLAWTLDLALDQLRSAGLRIAVAHETRVATRVLDVAALIWYLRMVPWVVPDFSVAKYAPRLRELHQISTKEPLSFEEERFFIVAERRS